MACCHPLVGHDGTAASAAAVRRAESLALEHHGRMTIVLAIPRVPPTAGWAPVDHEGLRRDLEAAALQGLRRSVDELSSQVSVTTVAATDRLGCALARAWSTGCHDRVVLAESAVPWAPRARAAKALRKHGVPIELVATPVLRAGGVGSAPFAGPTGPDPSALPVT